MFAWGAATRIHLAAGATDLRKGFDGLYALLQQRLELDSLSGHVFVFGARTRPSRSAQALMASCRPAGAARRFPRREGLLACPPQQQRHPEWGRQRVVIGCETSEQWDMEAARYFVVATKREKRACPPCTEAGVAVAAPPPRIVDKGLVSYRVVIATIVAEYAKYLPLNRQSVMAAPEVGMEISRATPEGGVMGVDELVTAVVVAMRRELLAGGYI